MAEPNFATAMALLAYAVDPLNHLQLDSADGTTGYAALSDAFSNALTGTIGKTAVGADIAQREGLSALLSREAVRARCNPLLRQVRAAIGYSRANATIEQIWPRLVKYMVDNSDSINSPEDTYDTSFSAGGSNVGTGEIIRLTVDEDGQALEGWSPDDLTLTCDLDGRAPGGEAHEERFHIEGTDAPLDYLTEGGSGLYQENLRALNARHSLALGITNPSWNTYSPSTGTITSLAGWTQNVGAAIGTNLAPDTTNVYRAQPGQTSNSALTVSATELIYQSISAARFLFWVPYLIDVAVRRNSSSTGNVTLRLSPTLGSGGISATVSLASLTADTWTRLRIAVGANCWPRNFNANGLYLQIEGGTISGSFNVDDLVVAPFTRVGARGDSNVGRGAMGQYFAILGGQTPFVEGDVFTGSDTLGGTRAVLHHWLTRRAAYGYLPSATSAGETIADR